MPPTNPDEFDLYIISGFLDVSTCQALIADMRHSSRSPAFTYGTSEAGAVDERVRKVTQVTPSPDVLENVARRLDEVRPGIESHFGIALSECEPPQFLCYGEGDFFVAHQDGNTGMVRLDSDSRRVSVTIFLNSETREPGNESYVGGSLVFSDGRSARELHLSGEAGTLVAFHSELTHEVKPVLRGERFAIVTWFRPHAPDVSG